MNHSEGRNPSNCNDNKKTDSKAGLFIIVFTDKLLFIIS